VFSIGEFSRITALTVKTLRFYHERGLLVPAYVDPQTGYRNYTLQQVDRARIISQLRNLEFSLEQIAEFLAHSEDEAGILGFLERQRAEVEAKMRHYRGVAASLATIIAQEREAQRIMAQATFEVQEKTLEPLLVAGVRMKGRYKDCGKGFSQIGRALGRFISGKCMLLHYDTEYHEDDADFEACMPLRQTREAVGISVRQLPGGRCVSLLHKGPYETLTASYARIVAYLKTKGYEVLVPTREVYLKGPGMIFRGNPKNYLTEIQMLVKE
jgi:DNA-binding transcriptional MerR regulator